MINFDPFSTNPFVSICRRGKCGEMVTTKLVPSALTLSGAPQALCATSTGTILAGLLNGTVEVHSLTSGGSDSLSIESGTGSIRALLSCGSTRACAALSEGSVSLLDLDKGEVECTWNTTDKERTPSALLGFSDGAHIGYVGDNSGGLSHIDMRVPTPLISTLEHGDYVSDLAYVPGNPTRVLAASGDGTLGIYDTRAGKLKLFGLSESFDDDLTCLAVDDSGIVIGGTLEGAMHSFNSGELANMEVASEGTILNATRFCGHPDSVNAILTRSELVVTGCSDGLVRVLGPHDGKLLGVLQFDRSWAQTENSDVVEKWPVEAIAIAKDADGNDVLALAGHEECIRFASLSLLDESDEEVEGKTKEEKEGEDSDSEEEGGEKKRAKGKKRKRGKKAKQRQEVKRQKDADNFFGDL